MENQSTESRDCIFARKIKLSVLCLITALKLLREVSQLMRSLKSNFTSTQLIVHVFQIWIYWHRIGWLLTVHMNEVEGTRESVTRYMYLHA